MTIGDVIKNYREEHRLSQRQFAVSCNVSNGYISMLERGENPKTGEAIMPSLTALNAIASAMGITVAELLATVDDFPDPIPCMFGSDEKSVKQFSNIFPLQTKKVRFLGGIACGKPIYAEEEKSSYASINIDVDCDFCLQAKGDSMIGARIYDGDLVFCRETEMVQNGEIAAVIIGDEATLKRVYYYPEQNRLVLQAENPAFAPMIFDGERFNDIRIIGRAVAFQSVVK